MKTATCRTRKPAARGGKTNLIPNPQSLIPLIWPSRPRCIDDTLAVRRAWTSRCGRYRVVKSRLRYGSGKSAYPVVFRAEKLEQWAGRQVWELLGGPDGCRHRTKQAAMRHCEQDAREGARD